MMNSKEKRLAFYPTKLKFDVELKKINTNHNKT